MKRTTVALIMLLWFLVLFFTAFTVILFSMTGVGLAQETSTPTPNGDAPVSNTTSTNNTTPTPKPEVVTPNPEDDGETNVNVNVNNNQETEQQTNTTIIKQFENGLRITGVEETENAYKVTFLVGPNEQSYDLNALYVFGDYAYTSEFYRINEGETTITVDKRDGTNALALVTGSVEEDNHDYYELHGESEWFDDRANPLYTFALGLGVYIISLIGFIKYKRKNKSEKIERKW